MPEISSSHWHRADRVKTCIMCREMLPISEFYAYAYITRQGKRSTRYESRCESCARARRLGAYHANPDQSLASSQRWRDGNRDRIKAYNARRAETPDHMVAKAYYQRLRKARMRSGEGDAPEVRAIYQEAMAVEQLVADCPVFDIVELGKRMHVDHIIPLAKGGRHVASNLQVLPAGLNMRKGVKCPR